MDCREFDRALEALPGSGGPEDALQDHAAGCERCERRLSRQRVLSSVLGELGLQAAPPELDERVLTAARTVTPAIGLRVLLRVAAALLLLLGGAAAVVALRPAEPDYVPLELEVVILTEFADEEEELALEFIYGPEEAPMVAEAEGETGEPDNR